MSVAIKSRRFSAAHLYYGVALGLLVVLLVFSGIVGPHLFTLDGISGAIIVLVPLVLAAMALTPIALAGRGSVDLAIGPLIGFLNVTLIQWLVTNNVTSPVAVIGWVLALGIAYQLLQGAIIVFVRVAPIIVTLSGYLVLSGLDLVIMPKPSGSVPDWMSEWGSGTTVFTPVLLILIVGLAVWFLFTRTAFYQHLRLTGADERMAYASGVRTDLVRLGAHAMGGFFAGLAALAYTGLISSGDPTQGSNYTLSAVTALVLGGTSIAGGRGGIIGSAIGALDMYLITYVLSSFNFGIVSGFVTQLAFGVVLVLALLSNIFLTGAKAIAR
jgi:ribose transport system permease protein